MVLASRSRYRGGLRRLGRSRPRQLVVTHTCALHRGDAARRPRRRHVGARRIYMSPPASSASAASARAVARRGPEAGSMVIGSRVCRGSRWSPRPLSWRLPATSRWARTRHRAGHRGRAVRGMAAAQPTRWSGSTWRSRPGLDVVAGSGSSSERRVASSTILLYVIAEASRHPAPAGVGTCGGTPRIAGAGGGGRSPVAGRGRRWGDRWSRRLAASAWASRFVLRECASHTLTTRTLHRRELRRLERRQHAHRLTLDTAINGGPYSSTASETDRTDRRRPTALNLAIAVAPCPADRLRLARPALVPWPAGQSRRWAWCATGGGRVGSSRLSGPRHIRGRLGLTVSPRAPPREAPGIGNYGWRRNAAGARTIG